MAASSSWCHAPGPYLQHALPGALQGSGRIALLLSKTSSRLCTSCCWGQLARQKAAGAEEIFSCWSGGMRAVLCQGRDPHDCSEGLRKQDTGQAALQGIPASSPCSRFSSHSSHLFQCDAAAAGGCIGKSVGCLFSQAELPAVLTAACRAGLSACFPQICVPSTSSCSQQVTAE